MDFPFVCLAAHDSEASSMDPLKRQTSTATPAEPGELLWILAKRKGVTVRWRLKEAWSKAAARWTRTG